MTRLALAFVIFAAACVAEAAPVVRLLTPAAATRILPGASITLSADASDSEDAIARVEFHANGELLGSVKTPPYTFDWNALPPGRYNLVARAISTSRARAASAPVRVVVNTPPEIRLVSPAPASSFVAPASIALAAEVSDAEGEVAKVQFFDGHTLLATVEQAPYTFTWADVAKGRHVLHARAVDSLGGATVSSKVAVNVVDPAPPAVNLPPLVSMTAPAAGARLDAGASVTLKADASDADGRIVQVEFLVDGRVLGGVTAPPYEFNWRADAPGSYRLSARVTDDAGGVTSAAPIEVSVIHPPAAVFYIHTDHLGTPRVIASEAGDTVWAWDSDPFGVIPPNEDPRGTGAPFRCNLRFPGQYFDAETGLHYNYLRDYDPASGRYVQSDPTGLRGGLNTYLYANANPLQLVDPTGEIALLIPVAFAAAEGAAGWALPAAAGLAVAAAVVTQGDSSFASQQKQERDDYHRICDEKNNTGDRCEDARKKKARAEMCFAMRQNFASKWFGGTYDPGHQQQMIEVLSRIRNAERDIRKYCECS